MLIRCPRCTRSSDVSGQAESDGALCVHCGGALWLDSDATLTRAVPPDADATLARDVIPDADATLTRDVTPDAAAAVSADDTLAADPGGTADAVGVELRQTLGRFELVELLGTGSFGSVWRAWDPELQREVAVKVPRRALVEEGQETSFLREARALAQLQHPHIVRVHEVGRDQDAVFIVSDYIRGQTLELWSADRALDPRDIVGLCIQIALALHHAHEAGVTHRDLKPANILMDESGQPHIMDFGLAKRDAGDTTQTVAGRIMGSPAYMSPEQARGDSHLADPRSDIYALGIVLYELLTGERPFRGNVSMLLKQILDDEPPPLRKLHSQVPRDLEVICLKCLEKSPERRYQTADELAADLRRWLALEPIRARPVSYLERCLRWCQRRPVVTGLSALAGALALTTLLVLAAAYVEQRRALRESLLRQAKALRQTEQAGRRDQALQALTLAARIRPGTDLRDEFARCRELDDLRLSSTIDTAGWPNTFPPLVAAHGGQLLVVGGRQTALFAWKTGQQVDDLPACRDLITPAAVSADGNLLAAWNARTGRVELWNLDERQLACTLATGHESPRPSTLALDDSARRQVAVILHPATAQQGPPWIGLFDGGTGALLRRWNLESAWMVPSLVFSPDGSLLAVEMLELKSPDQPPLRTMKLWNAQSGELLGDSVLDPLPSSLEQHWPGRRLDFSPDGKWLAAAADHGSVRLLAVDEVLAQPAGPTGASRSLAAHAAAVTAAQFSPDGRVLLTAGKDGWLKLWDVTDGKLLVGTQGEAWIHDAGWTPDGSGVCCLTADGPQAWDYQRPLSRQFLAGSPTSLVCAPKFSPSGRWLAWSDTSPQVRLVDLFAPVPAVQRLEGAGTLAFSGTDQQLGLVNSAGKQRWDLRLGVWTSQPGPTLGMIFAAFEDNRNRLLVACIQSAEPAEHDDGSANGNGTAGPGNSTPADRFQVWDLDQKQRLLDVPRLATDLLDERKLVWFRQPGIVALLDDATAGTVRLFDLASGEETWRESFGAATCLAGAGDGACLAVGQPDGLRLVDLAGRRTVANLQPLAVPPLCLSLDAEGLLLAAAFWDGTVRLWDVRRRRPLSELSGGDETFPHVALSPDRNWLAAASSRGSVRIWDLNRLRSELRSAGLDWPLPSTVARQLASDP
ncbi:MAG: protein kinase [Pirellulaceae bacterium]|nr:protein kinase [Pirellulaceae bacterium]